jgi:hypothetical protein
MPPLRRSPRRFLSCFLLLLLLLLLYDPQPSRANYNEIFPTSAAVDPDINSSPEFGRSVAAAGPYFVVGDPVQDFSAGCAYVYTYEAGRSVMIIALTSANASAGDKCGSRVAIADDLELDGWTVIVSFANSVDMLTRQNAFYVCLFCAVRLCVGSLLAPTVLEVVRTLATHSGCQHTRR